MGPVTANSSVASSATGVDLVRSYLTLRSLIASLAACPKSAHRRGAIRGSCELSVGELPKRWRSVGGREKGFSQRSVLADQPCLDSEHTSIVVSILASLARAMSEKSATCTVCTKCNAHDVEM